MNLVLKVAKAGARGKELDLVLPVFANLLEGVLKGLLDILVELVPVEGTSQSDGDVRRAVIEFFTNLGNEIVENQGNASF